MIKLLKVTKQVVVKLADLAMLELRNGESLSIAQALQSKLEHLAIFNEVQTEGVRPLFYVSSAQNVFREDQVGKCLTPQEALANTQENAKGCFKVPRIV